MKTFVSRFTLTLAVLLIVAALPLAAEQHEEQPAMPDEMKAMMEAWEKAGTPGDPHAGLAEMAGTWTFTIKSWMDPAGEPMKSEGTAERTMLLGGRVLQEKVSSMMMGQQFDGIGMTGFDNVSGKYWSAWMDSMSTGCYVMHGSKDESGTMTFSGKMEDPMRGTVHVRSTSRMEGDDKQIFEWHEKRGKEYVKTMEIVYVRAAS